MTERPEDKNAGDTQELKPDEQPDGGPLHGGEGDPLGEGLEEAGSDS